MLVVLFLMLASLAVNAETLRTEDANVKFINSSGVTLRFSIDGRAGPTIPSGEQGFDITSVGNHTFKAETLNGKQSVMHSAYVGKDGCSWTVTPPKKQ